MITIITYHICFYPTYLLWAYLVNVIP